MTAQDVSKKGLKFGDEDEDEAEKRELEAQKIAFAPLTKWLKANLGSQISDGMQSLDHAIRSELTNSCPDQSTCHIAMYHRGRYVTHNTCRA